MDTLYKDAIKDVDFFDRIYLSCTIAFLFGGEYLELHKFQHCNGFLTVMGAGQRRLPDTGGCWTVEGVGRDNQFHQCLKLIRGKSIKFLRALEVS